MARPKTQDSFRFVFSRIKFAISCATIIEASDRLGGRVKTDVVDGYSLDHGFQVLLTAYPAAKKYLDFDALELQEFLPGSAIFKNGKQKIIGDPLRNISLLIPVSYTHLTLPTICSV